MCCFATLRGAALFGASIHLCLGFIQMGRFTDFCFILFSNPKITYTLEYCLVTLANLLYSATRLPLSSLIFIGIEKNCIPLLTWTPIFHFLMQIFEFMLRIKYGKMVIQSKIVGSRRSSITNKSIGWVKEDFVIPDSVEKFVEETLFGFIFTTFHLLMLFFLVQNIETSVQGQVLDPSPGYSVSFFPHPIQPARWFSRFNSNNHRNFCLQSPTSFFPSARTDHNILTRARIEETRASSDNLESSSQTEDPPPYYYDNVNDDDDHLDDQSTTSAYQQEQVQPILTSQSTYPLSQRHRGEQDDVNLVGGQELDARTPLLSTIPL